MSSRRRYVKSRARFGGGWDWGLIPFIRSSPIWTNWESQTPWALSAIVTHLLRLLPASVILAFLLLMGLRRSDLFLVRGKIDALVEPSKLLGMQKPEPWTHIGKIFAIIFTVVTFASLMLAWKPSLGMSIKVLPLIPVALLIASMNAFNEEFTLRAAPLHIITCHRKAASTYDYNSIFWAWAFLWYTQ